jgi:hypothetical protein
LQFFDVVILAPIGSGSEREGVGLDPVVLAANTLIKLAEIDAMSC